MEPNTHTVRTVSSPLLNKILQFTLTSFLVLGIFIFSIGFSVEAARKFPKQDVDTITRKELNSILSVTSELHVVAITKKRKETEKVIRQLISKIDGVKQRTKGKDAKKRHIAVVLDSLKTHLEMTLSSSGEQRARNFQQAFSQVVYLAQSFKLDPYPMFFCSKDRAVWIQKSKKPQNPVSPEKFLNCGNPMP